MQIKDAEPISGRILADMEGLPAKKTPRASGGSLLPSHSVGWLAGVAGLAIIAGVFFWNFSRDAQQVTAGSAVELPAEAQAVAPSIKDNATPTEGAALIVNAPDEASASSLRQAQPVLVTQVIVEVPVAEKLAGAKPTTAEKLVAAPAARFARVAPSKASPRAAAPSRPKPATRNAAAVGKATNDETLLVTLLGIINEEDKAAGATSPQTIDDLIAHIEDNQRQHMQPARRGTGQAIERKPASTQSNIQAQLRRCPNPNTLQGVECRSRICAELDSKDPACPGN